MSYQEASEPGQQEGHSWENIPEALFNYLRGDDTESEVVRETYGNESRAECNDGGDNECVHMRPVSCYSLTHKSLAF